jgi:1-acyl-sn-glycerol-3-phosphate acyltransferase
LGGIPLPTELSGVRGFSAAVKAMIKKGKTVVVYPEGHLWPACPFLRPFKDGSLDYAVRLASPVYTLTRVYVKRKRGIGSNLYIDGPFYPDPDIPTREAKEKLCKTVREIMEDRLKSSDVEIIRYLPAQG